MGSISVNPCAGQDIGDTCTPIRRCSGIVQSAIETFPRTDNRIGSPWTYGNEPNGDPPGFAQELEPGAKYSVIIDRYGPCDDNDPECVATVASSCAVFTIPE
ncbi:MAG: hypothetical protein AAGA56_01105 [Myxococcota bacterium]